jgi:hypothetical protein
MRRCYSQEQNTFTLKRALWAAKIDVRAPGPVSASVPGFDMLRGVGARLRREASPLAGLAISASLLRRVDGIFPSVSRCLI